MAPDSLAHAAAPAAPSREAGRDAETRADLLRRLGLRTDAVLSDDNESFVTLRCRDEDGRQVVLKYVHSGSADALRRLRNEALLFTHLRVRDPLRLLRRRADGPGYLVTDYDPGTLLRPDRFDDRVAATIAVALAQFQTIPCDVRALGLVDRERLSTYYVKVLTKHLLHLWPAHLSASQAARCVAILTGALPAIHRRRVICHGDLLPTNLLRQTDGSITVTDLEGFMSRNHPLFDLLAFFTISGLDLADWAWQRAFLARYWRDAAAALQLDPRSADYRAAYRGILTFFLVYRLNEERLLLSGGSYFEGLGKRRFVARKALRLAAGTREVWRDDSAGAGLDVRKRNLQYALSAARFEEHFEAMHAGMTSP